MKIDLDNISFAYGPDTIIRDVNCRFVSGCFYSIIGPNGSGKTTLLDLISGFSKPCSGRVLLDQSPLASLSKKEIAKKIAVVSQDYAINFPFSVTEVVMMGRHPHIHRFSHPSDEDFNRVDSVMDLCEIRHLSGRRITELSGGERQRCVFARALCQDTPILLLDEAFSNMDINHTLQLLRLVKQSVKEKNRIVVSVFHDLNLASGWSDRILMMKDGQISAAGNSRDVLTEENIKAVFNVASIVAFNPHVQAKQVYYPSI